MAKKKVAEEAVVEQSSPPPPRKLADVIREAFTALGKGADATTAEVTEWITATYPDLELKDASINSTCSKVRHELTTGENGPAKKAKGGSTATTTLPLNFINDMIAIKVVAEEHGGVDSLLERVKGVADIASKFGGVDNLCFVLEAIQKLQ
jgi:hypothetical protein